MEIEIKKPELTEEFKQWVLDNIPMLGHMQVNFEQFQSGKLTMSCPLAPNINDKGTGFGGSIGALATICGWTFTTIHAQCAIENPEAMIVEQTMTFHAPVTGDFTATCCTNVPEEFFERLSQGRAGKLNLEVQVHSEGILAATYQGFYVARARS